MSNSYFHVCDREDAVDIIANGFLGGWGDVGFGSYFYGNPGEAESYAMKGGWDGDLVDPVILEIETNEVEKVIPEPSWPNPEDYSDVWFKPMDEDNEELAWKPASVRMLMEVPRAPVRVKKNALGASLK